VTSVATTPIQRPPRDEMEGQRAKTWAIVFGLIGFFAFAGLLFGGLAIWQANKAEAAGVRANGWRVLGIVDMVLSAIALAVTLH